MAGTREIRDLILAAAEGATSGVAALRAAGIPAALGSFSVEIDYDGGGLQGPEVGAVVKLSIVAADGGEAGTGPGPTRDIGSPPAVGCS
jgi:hypothetical protein